MSRITPHILIGGIAEAYDYRWLKSQGVTHIVNAAIEVPNFYPNDFTYLRLHLLDVPQQNLNQAFDKSYVFIKRAINGGGTVFVHCMAGVSRSSSIVINYLMRDSGYSYNHIYSYVKSRHSKTEPNSGFVNQLRRVDRNN